MLIGIIVRGGDAFPARDPLYDDLVTALDQLYSSPSAVDAGDTDVTDSELILISSKEFRQMQIRLQQMGATIEAKNRVIRSREETIAEQEDTMEKMQMTVKVTRRFSLNFWPVANMDIYRPRTLYLKKVNVKWESIER